MSLDQVFTSLPFVGGKKDKASPQHPLGPLTANEISESATLIKALWPSNTNIQFKTITLQEPTKAELLPFLEAEHAGRQTHVIERRSFVVYYLRNTVSLQSLIIVLQGRDCFVLGGGKPMLLRKEAMG
jgi:primary-amine oxidase